MFKSCIPFLQYLKCFPSRHNHNTISDSEEEEGTELTEGEYTIYILKCKNDKFYIGKTRHFDSRVFKHSQGNGAYWTKKYKPIEVLEYYENCSPYDEDKYTLIY